MQLDSSKYIYRLQEAFVYSVLLDLYGSKQVLWNPVPSPVDLDADFVVTDKNSKPKAVFCITHGTSQNAHQAKAWRDMHELFLYRIKLPDIITIRILFGNEPARGWHRVLERFFDYNLVTGEHEISEQINSLFDKLTSEHGIDNSISYWAKVIRDLPDQSAVKKCAVIIKEATQKKSETYKIGSDIIVRGNYSKFFLPSSLRRAVAFSGITGISDPSDFNPQECKPFVEKTVFGNRIDVNYRRWLDSSRNFTGNELFQYLFSRSHEEMTVYRKRSSSTDLFRKLALKSIELYKKNDWSRLEDLHNQGFKLVEKCGGNPLWLGLRYFLRSVYGDSYGTSWLCREAGKKTGVGNLFSVSAVFTGESGVFPADVFGILVKTASEIRQSPPVSSDLFRIILFEEAVKSRHLEPLLWIIEHFCEFKGHLATVPTLIDQTGKTGTIRGYVLGDTFFYWKTAYDGHRDKTKEMAARGLSLALSENPFQRRALLLDGSFTGRDLETLARSGWTDIFSVSNLDSLRRFIMEFH